MSIKIYYRKCPKKAVGSGGGTVHCAMRAFPQGTGPGGTLRKGRLKKELTREGRPGVSWVMRRGENGRGHPAGQRKSITYV